LAGALHTAATGELFAKIGAEVGTFSLSSAGGGDLREAPGTLVIDTPTGGLVAVAAPMPRYGVRRLDPVSGRPLRADAAIDATCPSGIEPACWLPPDDPLAQSLTVFDALCDATRGYSGLDRSACVLTIGTSQASYGGVSLAQINGVVVSGSIVGRNTLIGALFPWLAGVPNAVPTIRLNQDAADGPADGFFGANSLTARLTAEQGSSLGCETFWASGCDSSGVDLALSEASIVTQAWAALPGGPGVAPAARNGVAIAGTRGPADVDYDASIDGCATSGPAGCDGATTLLHPVTGEPFASELAALSWNFLVQLVVYSQTGAKPEAPCDGAQDPLTCRTPDEFVASPDTLLRSDGCSYARPELCFGVIASGSYLTRLLDDDPSGAPLVRWLWEAGAAYEITSATGDLAGFAGGVAHVLGPEQSRVAGAEIAAAIVLAGPGGALIDSDSSLFLGGRGYGYAVAPETGVTALGVAALGALRLVAAARRRGRRVRAAR